MAVEKVPSQRTDEPSVVFQWLRRPFSTPASEFRLRSQSKNHYPFGKDLCQIEPYWRLGRVGLKHVALALSLLLEAALFSGVRNFSIKRVSKRNGNASQSKETGREDGLGSRLRLRRHESAWVSIQSARVAQTTTHS